MTTMEDLEKTLAEFMSRHERRVPSEDRLTTANALAVIAWHDRTTRRVERSPPPRGLVPHVTDRAQDGAVRAQDGAVRAQDGVVRAQDGAVRAQYGVVECNASV